MYDAIIMTLPQPKKSSIPKQLLDFPFRESAEEPKADMNTQFFSEAVFNNGKSKLDPILKAITTMKDELTEKISEQGKTNGKTFDPKSFWRSISFKDLEDSMKQVFGFRYVSVEPFVEKYNSKNGTFESKTLNCLVSYVNRFPIDGIVTDDGFYDKTHSLVANVYISLGLVKALTAEEILAVLLHEIGHNIDPALVNIKYAEVNVLSKYLTDRKTELTKSEEKVFSKILDKFKFWKKEDKGDNK